MSGNKTGLIHVYTGGGKGKTTAAAGMCIRAAGNGMSVLFAQFLKGRPTGETAQLEKCGVFVVRSPLVTKFIPYMNESELTECRREQRLIFETVQKYAPEYNIVVLDEVFGAISTGMINKEDLIEFIKGKPSGTELVLTGRDAPEDLIALADYVSDIKQVKHPYDSGVTARKGIEY